MNTVDSTTWWLSFHIAPPDCSLRAGVGGWGGGGRWVGGQPLAYTPPFAGLPTTELLPKAHPIPQKMPSAHVTDSLSALFRSLPSLLLT